MPPLSARTKALLECNVNAGEHVVEFYARWCTEIEKGEMCREAARFWSQNGRQELLRPGYSIQDALEDWDEAEHGERPEEESAAWFDDRELGEGECTFIYLDPVLLLPEDGFFVEALPPTAEGEREEDRRTVPLKELFLEPDIAHFNAVHEEILYPDPAPSTWHCTNCWKGNGGQCTISVPVVTTLREVLRAQPLYANVWVEEHGEGSGWNPQSLCTAHFEGITLGEDDNIEWDNYNGKSTEFVLAPPDNMRLWRLAGTAIGRFMFLLRRSSERVYAPGGIGVDSVRREFETLAAAERLNE